jgi:nascent polypeptide-associated complex subunit alpha
MSNLQRSRSEIKAHKAVLSLGLKPVNGVERVTLTIGPHKRVYSIRHPQVFKSDSSDAYVVFGELTFENEGSVESSYLLCEQISTIIVSTSDEKQEDDSTTDTENSSQKATVEEETVDVSGIEEEDINLVIQQSHVTRAEAIEALRNNENDVINAIICLML